MEDKLDLIDELVKYHPAYGVSLGWSEYVGGMADTGRWFYEKLVRVPKWQIVSLLKTIHKEQSEQPTNIGINDSGIILLSNDVWVKENSLNEINKFNDDLESRMMFD